MNNTYCSGCSLHSDCFLLYVGYTGPCPCAKCLVKVTCGGSKSECSERALICNFIFSEEIKTVCVK